MRERTENLIKYTRIKLEAFQIKSKCSVFYISLFSNKIKLNISKNNCSNGIPQSVERLATGLAADGSEFESLLGRDFSLHVV